MPCAVSPHSQGAYPFADVGLARRLERAEASANREFVEARARLSPHVGACWMEAGGAYAMFDGVASPLTQTFGLGLFETPTVGQLQALEDFFRSREAPVHHETSPVADSGLVPLLVARGYHPIEYSSVLYQPIADDAGAVEPGGGAAVRVRRVVDAGDSRWAQTAAEGWSEFAGLSDFMADIARVQAEARGSHRFLAELDGQAIATGGLVIHDGVALLAGASTIPIGRRKGAQLALLAARLRFALESGCDIAMMAALPGSGSQRNAERHGFRIAYTRVKWQLT